MISRVGRPRIRSGGGPDDADVKSDIEPVRLQDVGLRLRVHLDEC
jgi:hypothetical protein